MFKRCTTCGVERPTSAFRTMRAGRYGVGSKCKACVAIYNRTNAVKQRRNLLSRQNYLDHRDSGRLRTRDYHRRIREEVLRHYGHRCACCGETHMEFLAIDHVNGGGRQHRKEIGIRLAAWLRQNNYPEGFRLLCHSCNMSLALYGYCPHQSPQAMTAKSIGTPESGLLT